MSNPGGVRTWVLLCATVGGCVGDGSGSEPQASAPVERVLKPLQGGSCEIYLDPLVSAPGEYVLSFAGGFDYHEQVAMQIDAEPASLLQAYWGQLGYFLDTGTLAVGAHAVTLIGQTSGVQCTQPFEIVPTTAYLSPTRGGPGRRVGVIGYGWPESQTVQIYYDGVWLSAGFSGAYMNFAFSMPEGGPDETWHDVELRSQDGLVSIHLAYLQTGYFRALQPSLGQGAPLVVEGGVFNPYESVTIRLWGHVLGNLTTDADGNFSAPVTIPDDFPPGDYVLEARGVTSQTRRETTFQVRARSVSLSPDHGGPMRRVTLVVDGYPPGWLAFGFPWDASFYAQTDATGHYQGSFNIPLSPRDGGTTAWPFTVYSLAGRVATQLTFFEEGYLRLAFAPSRTLRIEATRFDPGEPVQLSASCDGGFAWTDMAAGADVVRQLVVTAGAGEWCEVHARGQLSETERIDYIQVP